MDAAEALAEVGGECVEHAECAERVARCEYGAERGEGDIGAHDQRPLRVQCEEAGGHPVCATDDLVQPLVHHGDACPVQGQIGLHEGAVPHHLRRGGARRRHHDEEEEVEEREAHVDAEDGVPKPPQEPPHCAALRRGCGCLGCRCVHVRRRRHRADWRAVVLCGQREGDSAHRGH
ncbi:hypothetical protein NESM_000912600 [Novymonas esmeraldas]|uniref:Uncharacterized protein n=1 Tax=Novymonas esmeraldas TaxID=1808958 RepID=A0AAW0EZ34_9TRYP